MKRLFSGIGLAILLLLPTISGAQIRVAGEGPVVYGHHHLNTTNMDAQKKFLVDTLGGTVVTIGSRDRRQQIIKFPNVLIFFRPMQAPTGGSMGTTVNHIGFSAPDLKPLVAKIKANGFKMITTDSVAANVKVTNDIAAASRRRISPSRSVRKTSRWSSSKSNRRRLRFSSTTSTSSAR